MTPHPSALVLAGGGATRLGGVDKPLLDLAGGRSLLAWILATLAPQAAPIALSANGDPARFQQFGLPVLDDGPFAGQGPLAGVLTGLDWAATQGCAILLTVPGDTPFIPRDLATRLAPAPACASSFGRAHPLVALWPVSVRTALRQFLSRHGPRGVHVFAKTIGQREVDFPAVTSDPFLNVNTPEDWARACTLAAQVGTRGTP